MVVEAGDSRTGRPGVHEHTLAVYRLMDDLRERHPGLEIEACAGGGGRIDLEIIERTDRVWPSDCIDALERQQIQRYTQLLLPPELIGTHLGDAEAHTTRRRHHLGFRAAASIWGHMGIEWDLTAASPGERGKWSAAGSPCTRRCAICCTPATCGRSTTPTRRSGSTESLPPTSPKRSSAVTTVDRSVTFPPGRVRLPGLDPDRIYQVIPLPPGDRFPGATQFPGWWETGVTASGSGAVVGRPADPGDVPRIHPPHQRHRGHPLKNCPIGYALRRRSSHEKG